MTVDKDIVVAILEGKDIQWRPPGELWGDLHGLTPKRRLEVYLAYLDDPDPSEFRVKPDGEHRYWLWFKRDGQFLQWNGRLSLPSVQDDAVQIQNDYPDALVVGFLHVEFDLETDAPRVMEWLPASKEPT